VYGIAVPAESPIKTIGDLRGKRIGLISFASAGAIVARALVSEAGMNPDSDVSLVVAGEGAQTAALIRSRQVDALSQFDTQYAMVENAGIPLRRIATPQTDRFPSNGFLALDDVRAKNKRELIAVARGYAKGTIFAIGNPEAAIRILWEVYPQTKPTGKEEELALRDDIKTLEARAVNWRPERVGAKGWGESVEANYAAYLEFLFKWGVIKERVQAKDIITNAWLSEIVNFDPAQIAAEALAYKHK
jgi:NitT/TauT family transport system substrate-binding protein